MKFMNRTYLPHTLFLPALLLLCLTGCRTSRQPAMPQFVLVVDAGHGGNDQGAAGRRSQEKDITLKTAKRVCKLIRKQCKNVEVIQTRPDDEFVTLNDRAGMANFFRADLFISIHANSAKGWAEGTETFIHPTAQGSRSEKMARLLEAEYIRQGKRKSRGVKTANFAVLRQTSMPAILTEIGFISNQEEEKFIRSKKGQKRLARCICDAFIAYRRSYP